MIASDDPMGGTGSWVVGGAGHRFMSAVSCISSSRCIAVDRLGNAFFSAAAHSLSVSLLGSGMGTVTSTPISCPFATCSHEVPGLIEPLPIAEVACANTFGPAHGTWGICELDYPASNETALTPTPAPGSTFAGWVGDCAGSSVCLLRMSGDRGVSATFLSAKAGAALKPLAASAPRISSLHESNRAFAVARQRTPLHAKTAAQPKLGTVFSFMLDRSATVDVAISAAVKGTRVGHRCRRTRVRVSRAQRCTLYVKIATLTRTGHGGRNRIAFSGRVGRTALPRGPYRASFTAADSGGRSAAQDLSFTVLESSH
jgi:hypothetical protein